MDRTLLPPDDSVRTVRALVLSPGTGAGRCAASTVP